MTDRPSSRAAILWARVRDSLWFIPALATLTGIVGAIVMVEVQPPELEARAARLWLFSGGAEGARGVLSAIAGSLITVTGVVFSVTVVALQLASSQFTPRVLRGFVADRVNQIVLGVFIGTFTYTLLVLRTIRSSAADRETFVPHMAVLLALVLLLVSVAALIVFIDHAARSVQAGVILAREATQAVKHIERDRPPNQPTPSPPVTFPAEPAVTVTATVAGYVQAVDLTRLWQLAEQRALAIRMELRIGAFVIRGMPLASVWPRDAVDDAVMASIRNACVLGNDRTPEQDIEYGIVALSDIAVRALSPGINDPTTAMRCIDRLTQVLGELGQRDGGDIHRGGSEGRARLMMPGTSFERALGLAFDQIRHYGAGNPAIVRKLIDTCGDLARVIAPVHFSAVLGQLAWITSSADHADRSDRAGVEALASEVRALLTGPRP